MTTACGVSPFRTPTLGVSASGRRGTLARLRGELRRFGHAETDPEDADGLVVPEPLRPLLAAARRPGSVVEIVGSEPAGLTLAGLLAAGAAGHVVLIDPSGAVSTAALGLLGVDLARLLVVRPKDRGLALWAAEQSLRCPGVSVTLCRCGPSLGTTAGRRLKLAAEAGGGVGLVVRPAAREPPFGEVRLVVKSLPSRGTDALRPRLAVEAVYQRGCTEGVRCELELSAEITGDASPLSLVPPLARPASPRRRVV